MVYYHNFFPFTVYILKLTDIIDHDSHVGSLLGYFDKIYEI